MSLANRTIDLASQQILKAAAGTAAAPSITRDSDTDTGIFFPAADTIAFAEGGAEAMRIDSSGNVGIGTSSITSNDWANSTTALQINNADGWGVLKLTGSGSNKFWVAGGTSAYLWNSTSVPMIFGTNNTERLRITSEGVLLLNRTSIQASLSFSCKLQVYTDGADYVQGLENAHTSIPYGIFIRYSAASPNNTGSNFLTCIDGGPTLRATIRSDGGFANYSANNINLSDERLKTDIQSSPSYLDKICSIPVVNFKYKDQTHDDYNLGVIAQQVEAVCPELVDSDGFGEIPEDGVPLKSIYQTDLQYALMKCVQELKAENDSLKSRIAALEAT